MNSARTFNSVRMEPAGVIPTTTNIVPMAAAMKVSRLHSLQSRFEALCGGYQCTDEVNSLFCASSILVRSFALCDSSSSCASKKEDKVFWCLAEDIVLNSKLRLTVLEGGDSP